MAVENTISVSLPNILTVTLMWVVGVAILGGVIILGKKGLGYTKGN